MTDGEWSMESAVEFVNRWCSTWNERRFDAIADRSCLRVVASGAR
jgi:hypothetical protein